MNLTKCSNGHFYDSDTYASCPHCNSGAAAENSTIAFDGGSGIAATVDLDSYKPASSPEMAGVSQPSMMSAGSLDDSKTISIYQSGKMETPQMSPTVGWLVCTKGKFYGQDFRLKSGRNFIGRGTDMDICLTGENTVSRDRHATIIHEPRKNIFIAQPGESRELFYVNGNVVLSPIQLKKNDVLQIGEVQLMLIPCCDEAFSWDQE
ncbi:MAG: FHA domain-containing protein [Lachnospiraceae bacterium]|nr:FHA domain-containing protein [Lachnospiraceae bacterium]